jgi:hypothetical protein
MAKKNIGRAHFGNRNVDIVAGGFLGRAVISGGSAGDHTVTGIAVGDQLLSVLYYAGAGSDVTDVSDLTSEFSITAANTINNTGGTDTSSGKLVVDYYDLT